jgi:hypothetical protein
VVEPEEQPSGAMAPATFKSSSRMRPLEASQMPFCWGFPGAMKCQGTLAFSD